VAGVLPSAAKTTSRASLTRCALIPSPNRCRRRGSTVRSSFSWLS